jgi:hypothetical protein
MVNAVVMLDTKESSAVLALLHTMSHIEMSRNCSALLATHLARDPAVKQALKVCKV